MAYQVLAYSGDSLGALCITQNLIQSSSLVVPRFQMREDTVRNNVVWLKYRPGYVPFPNVSPKFIISDYEQPQASLQRGLTFCVFQPRTRLYLAVHCVNEVLIFQHFGLFFKLPKHEMILEAFEKASSFPSISNFNLADQSEALRIVGQKCVRNCGWHSLSRSSSPPVQ